MSTTTVAYAFTAAGVDTLMDIEAYLEEFAVPYTVTPEGPQEVGPIEAEFVIDITRGDEEWLDELIEELIGGTAEIRREVRS